MCFCMLTFRARFSYVLDEEDISIVMQYCSQGDLQELLKKRKRLTETETQAVLYPLVNTVAYLHGQSVLHGDLKLKNIFMDHDRRIYVGDFGLASRILDRSEKKLTLMGTPNYIAPEIIDGEVGYSFEVDIWSLGVIMFTLLCGTPPFETKTVKDTLHRIRHLQYTIPSDVTISRAARSLIQRLLAKLPNERPSLEEILQDAFFSQSDFPLTLSADCYTKPLRWIHACQMSHVSVAADTCSVNTESSDVPVQKHDPDKSVAAKAVIPVCVAKWVDYSSKYGFGYLLSDDRVGVLFNDDSIMLASTDSKFIMYGKGSSDVEDTDDLQLISYSREHYPVELRKKVILLFHFADHLRSPETSAEKHFASVANPATDDKNAIYVDAWMRSKHAIIISLSDRTTQCIFVNKEEIIFPAAQEGLWVTGRSKQRQFYSSAAAKAESFHCKAGFVTLRSRSQFSREEKKTIPIV